MEIKKNEKYKSEIEKILEIKKWLNSLNKIQKFVLIIVMLGSIFFNIVLKNIMASKEKELAKISKEYENSVNTEVIEEKNKNSNNENSNLMEEKKTTETISENNYSSTSENIDDIKSNEIRAEAKKKGMALTNEQIEELTLYEMGRRMKENLENDPELQKELEEALDGKIN